MNCKIKPLKNQCEISYRVKCVNVENERVFGDVVITEQTRKLDGYHFPEIYKRKKRNLTEQLVAGPDFMELNKKLPARRYSMVSTATTKKSSRRTQSMGDLKTHEFDVKELNVDATREEKPLRSLKTYPAPLTAAQTKQEVQVTSLVDQLLLDIYGLAAGSRSESDSTASSLRQQPQHQYLQKARLLLKSTGELQVLIVKLREHINHTGSLLVRQLRRKDYLIAKREKHCDIITAHLQAYSPKRIEDTKMRFSLTPQPGESGFQQWLDAMKMVARLPGGIPPEFRKRLWLILAERHLEQRGVDWKQAEKVCFNEWSNPDDEELGIQIVKDLHRTGCSLFCGAAGRDNQAVLRRVLLGFARWNKSVGYCQGLNVLAALVLQVMDRAESSAVKVMIYLIEGVLPEGYFADNLRGLSVDMAVFRDLLRARMPKLSKHLEALQSDAKDKATVLVLVGNSYEPPLTNVFTMQWFLTLFCHCLPQDAVLRVWDLIFLEGDEVLLRTALAIWEGLSDRIMTVTSADEFYSIMGVLTREMLEFTDTNNLIKNIVSLGPLNNVTGLREKHRYNITPWARKLSDDEDSDTEEDERLAVAAAMYSMAQRLKKEHIPSTVGALQAIAPGSDRERLALDISTLKQQYAKLRERQRQAHIILSAACARQSMVPPASQAMNHLLVGKNALVSGKSRPLSLSSNTTPSKSRPAALHSPRIQNRKERQGVTLHWKDTKRPKQKSEETADVKEGSASVKSPEDSAVDMVSPKRSIAGVATDSDSDSTSTELCDEPDRLSDIDSEEQTSTSDNYVMVCDEDKIRRNSELSTEGDVPCDVKSNLTTEPAVCQEEVKKKFAPTGEQSSQNLCETSISRITDEIRRLSNENDNNAMLPQALCDGGKKDKLSVAEDVMLNYKNEDEVGRAKRSLSNDWDYLNFNYDAVEKIRGSKSETNELAGSVNEEVTNNVDSLLKSDVDECKNDVEDKRTEEKDIGETLSTSDLIVKYGSLTGECSKVKEEQHLKTSSLLTTDYDKRSTESMIETKKEDPLETLLQTLESPDKSEDQIDRRKDKDSDKGESNGLGEVQTNRFNNDKLLSSSDTEDKHFGSLLTTNYDEIYRSLEETNTIKRYAETSAVLTENYNEDPKLSDKKMIEFETTVTIAADEILISCDTKEKDYLTSLSPAKDYKTLSNKDTYFQGSSLHLSKGYNETLETTSIRKGSSTLSKDHDTVTYGLSDVKERNLETSLSPAKNYEKYKNYENSVSLLTCDTEDRHFEKPLPSISSSLDKDKRLERSNNPFDDVHSTGHTQDTSGTLEFSSRALAKVATNSAEENFYCKSYVIGHIPISPTTMNQKLSRLRQTSYNIDNSDAESSDTRTNCIVDKSQFSNKQESIVQRQGSPKTPDSGKSFSSGETMGPDSKASSITVSPKTPVKSQSRDFSMDKSVCSSISSDSKTLILQSVESDVAKESPKTDTKLSSYERSSASTPISTDSLRNKSEASPKFVISSSSDSCSPSKVKSSERSFSSDLLSPVSANSIKYTSNYGKRGEGDISISPLDLSAAASPFYPIAHPNHKTPSPYGSTRRRSSMDSVETSPETSQKLSVSSKESSKYSPYQTKLDASLKSDGKGSSSSYKKREMALMDSLMGEKRDATDLKSYGMTSGLQQLSYTSGQSFNEDNADDQTSEKDVVPQLPQEKFDKHFMNLNCRHKDRSRIFERSCSSLDRRFADLKSSASTDEFSTSMAKKRSSDILEDIKHLEAKALSEGSSETAMLTNKTSYIWEDFKNLEARRHDTFSNSARSFSRQRLDIPNISLTPEGRKSYVLQPKINIDENSDSILKTVTRNRGNDDSDDGRESKLGVWTKVKPRKKGNDGRRSSDRALKIIQENSAILHKILACQAKKRLPDLEEISKEITISPINEEISKIFSPILEKMGLNEHEINEELARINFKDLDHMAATSVSEFDAKINDELSKLSLIDDTEQIDNVDVDEIISSDYLDTREALIDRKINEELSKLLANYEDEPRLSVATLEKGSSSQNMSDIEGLDLTSISTNVFSYKSSNDSIETRSDQGSMQESAIVPSERFAQYAEDLSPKSDIDIYRELEKLDKISAAQVIPDTSLNVSPKALSPTPYGPGVASASSYVEAPTSAQYSPKTVVPFERSPLKTSYDPYKSFDYKSTLTTPRRVASNPYTTCTYDNSSRDTNFDFFNHKSPIDSGNPYDLHLQRSPILTKELLEFRVRYDNDSPRSGAKDFFAPAIDGTSTSLNKGASYYENNVANKAVTPTKYASKEGTSYLHYPAESSDVSSKVIRGKYDDPLSPRDYGSAQRSATAEYEKHLCALAAAAADSSGVASYLTTHSRDYQLNLSPNRQQFSEERFPSGMNYLSSKLSPSTLDESKRPISHPEFPNKVNVTNYAETSSRGSSCYKKSSLSLGSIGCTNKSIDKSPESAASPKSQFSPFPVKNTSMKRKELALKLGLYSPKSSEDGQLKRL